VSWPIDKALKLDVVVSKKESLEADELLRSVIEHWSVLKNTSIDGLREAFLQRIGLLEKQDNGWILRVETKGHDLLLDNIPWTYTSIEFPWDESVIFTEWNYKK
jgi:hypothetical protein